MPNRTDESLFAAFRTSRDCHALGLLFHRRADELLRLAVFLAPHPSDADDLVQATFLSAIARAETFVPGNRVMSWLCGILTNHARMLRRAQKRASPQPCLGEPTDPADAALHAELRHALQQGIAGLPEPYRSVVSLHLEDGLDSQEISQRLARRPATVRKQMERALERLRTVLPLGLATAVVARVNVAQIAAHAADAARFVEPLARAAAPRPALPRTVAAATGPSLVATVLLGVCLAVALWQSRASGPPRSDAVAPPAAVATIAAASSAAVTLDRIDATAAGPEATAAALASLVVRAHDTAGAGVHDLTVLLVSDDGRPLPERLLLGAAHAVVTDAEGVATFAALPPGPYDLTHAGATVERQVLLHAGEQSARLAVPPRVELAGLVSDPAGRGIADAEVVVSETSLRGDLGVAIARTRADGTFAGACHLQGGRVFARHPDHADGKGLRLEPNRALRLVLPHGSRTVGVVVTTADDRPVADAYVALVPRSFATSFLPPQHARTDVAGTCRFRDPGPRECTVLASLPGLAPTRVDLLPTDSAVQLRLLPGGEVRGIVYDRAGSPLVDHAVTASVADQRSNEPVAPLVARASRTDGGGNFVFANLPPGSIQVRVQGRSAVAAGQLPFVQVLAAADIDVAAAATTAVVLRADSGPALRGRLATPAGRPVAGWTILATPVLGTALHRTFRGRGGATDAEGNFSIQGLAAGEEYQVGAFLPGAPRRTDGNHPFACTVARPGESPANLIVDPEQLGRARLRCRVLLPSGEPAVGAELELRAVAFQAPSIRTAKADGGCEFGPLAAGEYWLAIGVPGFGTDTRIVRIDDDRSDLDLGTLQVEAGARAVVRILARGVGAAAGVFVVARSIRGDKFVVAQSDSRGIAVVPVLPPGESQLLIHGPGIAPLQRAQVLSPGEQALAIEVEPAPTIPITATFALADNPFVVNGPLHVQVWRGGELWFEHFVGAIRARGEFDLTTGLPAGSYRIVARALWNARAEASFDVDAHVAAVPLVLRLSR